MISICIKSNNEEILNYIQNQLISSNELNINYKKHHFKFFDNIIIHYKDQNIDEFYYLISKIVSKTIILFYESLLVKRIIKLNYFYFNDKDREIIFDEYDLIKNKNSNLTDSYIDSIMVEVENYLRNNKIILLSGFVNFRLDEYKKHLENLVVDSVNQYIIDKEYINFVNLLKSYIESKIPKDISINLLYINSKGILLSNENEYIELEPFNSSYLSDISFSHNDYVLNTLVGLLPRKIIVHLISPKDQFIKTIEMIFSNKVQLCEGCNLCRTYKLLKLE